MRSSLFGLICAVALLGATTARATPTRVVGLGDLGRYVEDDSNVLQYPGLIGKYSHFAFIDYGGNSGLNSSLPDSAQGNLSAGAFVRATPEFQIGVATSDFAPSEQNSFLGLVAGNANGANAAGFNELTTLGALRRYDLFLGYSLAKDMGLGLRLSYGSTTRTYIPDPNEKTSDMDHPERKTDFQAQREFRATLGFSGGYGSDFAYDTSIDFINYGLSDEKNTVATFNKGGGVGIGFSARLQVGLTKSWSLIPQISYRGSFFSLDELFTVPTFGAGDNGTSVNLMDSEKRAHSGSVHQFDLGTVAAWKAGKTLTFWIGPGFHLQKAGYTMALTSANLDQSVDLSMTQYALPYVKFGFELSPLEWLRVRGGAEKYTYSADITTTNVNNKAMDDEPRQITHESSGTGGLGGTGIDPAVPDFQVYIGASLVTQNGFALDFLVDNAFLKSGLGFFHKDFAVRAAASYKF